MHRVSHLVRALQHENVLSIVSYCTSDIVCYLTPNISGQSLYNWERNVNCQVHEDILLSMNIVKEDVLLRVNIAKGICYGMKYLHDSNVFHGSLKSKDILVCLKTSLFNSCSVKLRLCSHHS